MRESKDSTISNTSPEIETPEPKTIVELILSFPKALLELVSCRHVCLCTVVLVIVCVCVCVCVCVSVCVCVCVCVL